MDTSPQRNKGTGSEPVLAEKVDDDIANNKIVIHLRPGVKFHDGTELNADVVLWTFQRWIDAGRLALFQYWDGIQKLDDMTVQIKYKEYHNSLILAWCTAFPITSKGAYEKASGGDPEKGLEWERTHAVGTGPFMLKEYKRDAHLTWVKNPNYWRQGKPYLNAIEFRIIPDPMTCDLLLRAGGADYWAFIPGNPAFFESPRQGFTVASFSPGVITGIWPNTADPKSKWNDIRLRQALEYAINKKQMAKNWGADFFTPTDMLAPPGEWGYDPNYPTRNYDPQKARQLIKEAGYDPPLKAQYLVPNVQGDITYGTVIKQYLDAAGFQIDLDVADPGRYYGTIYGNNPGPDLAQMGVPSSDSNFLVTYMLWFSTNPIVEYSYLGHTPEQKALDEEANKIPDAAGQKAIAEKIIRYMTDQARVIPLLWFPISNIAAPYVHPAPYLGARWQTEDIWMEKH
jgi:peptide/nickel transport system substrate-binding protein